MAGDESSVLGSLKAINAAEATYAAGCGRGGYAQSLDDLSTVAIGTTQMFISPDLASNGVAKSGYVMNLSPDASSGIVTPAGATCNGAADDAMSGYFAEAHPARIWMSGQRALATDTRTAIFFTQDGSTIAPGMSGATPLR